VSWWDTTHRSQIFSIRKAADRVRYGECSLHIFLFCGYSYRDSTVRSAKRGSNVCGAPPRSLYMVYFSCTARYQISSQTSPKYLIELERASLSVGIMSESKTLLPRFVRAWSSVDFFFSSTTLTPLTLDFLGVNVRSLITTINALLAFSAIWTLYSALLKNLLNGL
jgi:hypothetical protein